MAAIKVRADLIKKALSKRHADDFFLTEVKNGPTQIARNLLIMDALAIKKSWSNPCIDGYEVKVTRNDFLGDNKWMGYLEYCNRFSFVCPTGMIQPDELPKEVGLVWYNPEKDSLFTKKKAVYQKIEMSGEMLMYIIMNRLDTDRHPFFSSQREMLELWLEDKTNRYELSHLVNKKIYDLYDEIRRLNRQIERLGESSKFLEEIKDAAKRYCDISVYHWGWVGSLIGFLRAKSIGLSPRAHDIIETVERLSKELAEITKDNGEGS